MKHTLIIGITDCGKYTNYSAWIEQADATVKTIKLSHKLDNLEAVASCDAIVLSGGEDVYPTLYGKPEYLAHLNPLEMDEKRDAFELQVIAKTQQTNKPLLGICRGLQLTNVFFGGTLVYDIPSVVGSAFHNKKEGKDQLHPVEVVHGSMINSITGQLNGEINSAHHQSANKIGEGLVATAFADKDIVEAIERKDPANMPWLLLVQWHPERITHSIHFSRAIRERFLEEARLVVSD